MSGKLTAENLLAFWRYANGNGDAFREKNFLAKGIS